MASSSSSVLAVLFVALLSVAVQASSGQSAAATSLTVRGSVYCDACHVGRVTSSSYFIEGATVAVRCRSKAGAVTAYVEARSGTAGEFFVHVGGDHTGDACVAVLVRSSTSACSHVAADNEVNVGAEGEVHVGPLAFRPATAAHSSSSASCRGSTSALHVEAYASTSPSVTPPSTPYGPKPPSKPPTHPYGPKPPAKPPTHPYGPKPPTKPPTHPYGPKAPSTKPPSVPYGPKPPSYKPYTPKPPPCPPPPAYTKPPSKKPSPAYSTSPPMKKPPPSSYPPVRKPPSSQYHSPPPPY